MKSGERWPRACNAILTAAAFLFIFAAWISPFFVVAKGRWPVDLTGSFGDTFGVINALFSGCAFALLILTAYMQRQELMLQREELERMREEASEQTKQFRLQTQIMGKQLEAAESQAKREAVKERSASLPVLSYGGVARGSEHGVSLNFKNGASPVFNVHIVTSLRGSREFTSQSFDAWLSGQVLTVGIATPNYPDTGAIDIWILYETGVGELLYDVYELSVLGGRYEADRVGPRGQPFDRLSGAIREYLDPWAEPDERGQAEGGRGRAARVSKSQ